MIERSYFVATLLFNEINNNQTLHLRRIYNKPKHFRLCAQLTRMRSLSDLELRQNRYITSEDSSFKI
jgi:hypothetical protein